MKRIRRDISDVIHRTMDSQIKVAVTGLSRAGKTAFITSLVNQFLHLSTADSMPFLYAARDKRIIGAKRIPQKNFMVPRFPYDEALASLTATAPSWPNQTRDVSEIRLSVKFKPTNKLKRLVSHSQKLYIDIVDYPGEWLLDLPLLDMTFEQWSAAQFNALKGIRGELAKDWLAQLDAFACLDDVDETQLAEISATYTAYLHQCKAAGLHWVQPGRFVLPGELDGAPVLQFFPFLLDKSAVQPQSHTNYMMLVRRYEDYKNRVVKAFYRDYFSTFDRQIVLVDCLSPLNAGYESFGDMQMALEQIMSSFKYGKNGVLRRLFAPKIDKVLFAATKADHVTPDQHANMVGLLNQMIYPIWQSVAYENIQMRCISMASVNVTQSGHIQHEGKTYAAIQGETLEGERVTLFPGDVPKQLPDAVFWQNSQFDFTEFKPPSLKKDQSIPHIRMDTALEFLLGDKLA